MKFVIAPAIVCLLIQCHAIRSGQIQVPIFSRFKRIDLKGDIREVGFGDPDGVRDIGYGGMYTRFPCQDEDVADTCRMERPAFLIDFLGRQSFSRYISLHLETAIGAVVVAIV